MARRGPQHELLQLLLQGGEQGTSEERLEQLYREVAPQVRLLTPDPTEPPDPRRWFTHLV